MAQLLPQEVLRTLNENQWDMKEVGGPLGFGYRESLYDFFKRYDLLEQFKAKLIETLDQNHWRSVAASEILGIRPQAMNELMAQFQLKENKKQIGQEIIATLKMVLWNLTKFKQEFRMKPGTSIYEFMKEYNLEDYFKKNIRRILDENDWNQPKTANSLGVSIPTVARMIEELDLKRFTDLDREKILQILEAHDWRLGEVRAQMGMTENMSYNSYFENYGLLDQLKEKLTNALKKYDNVISDVAKRFDVASSTIIEMMKRFGLFEEVDLDKEQILEILEKNDWKIGNIKKVLGIPGRMGIYSFFVSKGLKEELRKVLLQALEANRWQLYPTAKRFELAWNSIELMMQELQIKNPSENNRSNGNVKELSIDEINAQYPGQYEQAADGNYVPKALTGKEISDWISGKIKLAPGRTMQGKKFYDRQYKSRAVNVYISDTDNPKVLSILSKNHKRLENWAGREAIIAIYEDINLGQVLGVFLKEDYEKWLQGDLTSYPVGVYQFVESYNKAILIDPFEMDMKEIKKGSNVKVRPLGSVESYSIHNLSLKATRKGKIIGIVRIAGGTAKDERITLHINPDQIKEQNLKAGDFLRVVIREDPNFGTVAQIFKDKDFDFTNIEKLKPLATYGFFGEKGKGAFVTLDLALYDILTYVRGQKNLHDVNREIVKNLTGDFILLLMASGEIDWRTSFKLTSEEIEKYQLNNRNDGPLVVGLRTDLDYGLYVQVNVKRDQGLQPIANYYHFEDSKSSQSNYRVDFNVMTISDWLRGNKNIHGQKIVPRIYVHPKKISGGLSIMDRSQFIIKGIAGLNEIRPIIIPKKDDQYGWIFEVHDYEAYQKDSNRKPEAILVKDGEEPRLIRLLESERIFSRQSLEYAMALKDNRYDEAEKLKASLLNQEPVVLRTQNGQIYFAQKSSMRLNIHRGGVRKVRISVLEDKQGKLYFRLDDVERKDNKELKTFYYGFGEDFSLKRVNEDGSPQMNENEEIKKLTEEVTNAIVSLRGNPGDLLDILLTLYSEKYNSATIKTFVRRFEELNLGELINRHGLGGRGRGQILLDFYFQQASLVNQKDERDRQTLIEVFIKSAFRELMKEPQRTQVLDELAKRRSEGIFFNELYLKVRELVEEAMAYQPAHLKTQFLPHQAVASYFLNGRERAYVGDFTGAGKTIEVLGAIQPQWKSFVAVPANLIDNFVKEIDKHVSKRTLEQMDIVVLRGPPEERKIILENIRHKKNVLIIGSIQTLWRHNPDELSAIQEGLDLLVVDESQFIANFRGIGVKTNAKQAEALSQLQAKRKWFLSATGYGSNPHQLFSLLHTLTQGTEDEELFKSYKRFVKLFPHKADGLRYMRALLRKYGLSRQADEVMERYVDPKEIPFDQQGIRLPNLKEVSYTEFGGFELNDEQEKLLFMMVKDFRAFAKWYNERVPEEQHLNEGQMNPFTKLRFIFQLMVNPQKVGGQTESSLWQEQDRVVEKYHKERKKMVFFANNTDVLEENLERYQSRGIARIDGIVSGAARDKDGHVVKGYLKDGEIVIDPNSAKTLDAKVYQQSLFQNNPNIMSIAANAKAGAIGLDYTAGEVMIETQLPEVYTREVQMKGRVERPDPKRPRYQVDLVRMVAQFRPGLTQRWAGSEYEELAKSFEREGTPSEMQLARLETQKDIFKYVMTDLATEDEVNLFDPQSLAKAIPGFMEDPTMDQYLQTLGSRQLRKTLDIFMPLYTQAQSMEIQADVLKIAELFYRTGSIPLNNEFIRLMSQQDQSFLTLLASLRDIPNKFARNQWVSRVIKMITQEFVQESINYDALRADLDFLIEDASYLVLPVYEVSKGYENGATLKVLSSLLSEIYESHKTDRYGRYFMFQELTSWLMAVDSAYGKPDSRDALKEVMERYGDILINQEILLKDRLNVLEELLRLVSFPHTKDILFESIKENTTAEFIQALDLAQRQAIEETFSFSELEAQTLQAKFPAILTALQMGKGLKDNPSYEEEYKQLQEILKHIAIGDYAFWRNQQAGDRLSGEKISFMQEHEEFWNALTKEEFVPLTGIEVGVAKNKEQIAKVSAQVLEKILNEDSRIVEDIDGDFVHVQFKEWSSQPFSKWQTLGAHRNRLSQARKILKRSGNTGELDKDHIAALKREGFNLDEIPFVLAETIEHRLIVYQNIEDWLRLTQWLGQLHDSVISSADILQHKMILSKLIGRSGQMAVNFSDRLETLAKLLEHVNETSRYDQIVVELTTNPSYILERGMLDPQLTDCFNCYADPKQYSTLVDDLGSRNKLIAIVKVKQLEDGTPVLFPERSLSVGSYDFENEILRALELTKLAELKSFGTQLAKEGKPKDNRVKIIETGGYSSREYFEPLFSERDRTHRKSLIFHYGVIVSDAAMMNQDMQNPGGIDLNANEENLVEKGDKMKLPVNSSNWQNFQTNGFIPVIIHISPPMSLPLILSQAGTPQESEPIKVSSLN